MGCRPDRRGLTRAARFQAIPVRERLRGGRDERALLGCGRARSRADLKESSRTKLESFHSSEVARTYQKRIEHSLSSILSTCCSLCIDWLFHFVCANQRVHPNQSSRLSHTDSKIGIAFSKTPLGGEFVLQDTSNRVVFRGPLKPVAAPKMGRQLPALLRTGLFSLSRTRADTVLQLEESGATSPEFTIGGYPPYQEDLLFFMRQQRCGYNPYLDMVCHMRDGRTVYAPVPDGSFMDASGGWHDAGDQLKYLITASNATARMLLPMSWPEINSRTGLMRWVIRGPTEFPTFSTKRNGVWTGFTNFIPRRINCFIRSRTIAIIAASKCPIRTMPITVGEPNSYRPVYFADGKPQGLREWKSKATGVANIAGRSAAAMAMAYRIWKNDLQRFAVRRRSVCRPRSNFTKWANDRRVISRAIPTARRIVTTKTPGRTTWNGRRRNYSKRLANGPILPTPNDTRK